MEPGVGAAAKDGGAEFAAPYVGRNNDAGRRRSVPCVGVVRGAASVSTCLSAWWACFGVSDYVRIIARIYGVRLAAWTNVSVEDFELCVCESGGGGCAWVLCRGRTANGACAGRRGGRAHQCFSDSSVEQVS